jgi:hypothetical protein
MSTLRPLRYVLAPLLLVAVGQLLRYSAISLDQAFHAGLGEGLMMAWVLLFVVVVPLLLLATWVAGEAGRRWRRRRIIPLAGVKIP